MEETLELVSGDVRPGADLDPGKLTYADRLADGLARSAKYSRRGRDAEESTAFGTDRCHAVYACTPARIVVV
jgi:hypothetical protein